MVGLKNEPELGEPSPELSARDLVPNGGPATCSFILWQALNGPPKVADTYEMISCTGVTERAGLADLLDYEDDQTNMRLVHGEPAGRTTQRAQARSDGLDCFRSASVPASTATRFLWGTRWPAVCSIRGGALAGHRHFWVPGTRPRRRKGGHAQGGSLVGDLLVDTEALPRVSLHYDEKVGTVCCAPQSLAGFGVFCRGQLNGRMVRCKLGS